jgi:hypothetical protein
MVPGTAKQASFKRNIPFIAQSPHGFPRAHGVSKVPKTIKTRTVIVKCGKTDNPKPNTTMSASESINKKIAALDDWRGDMLTRLRKIIHDADPEVVEEWKWMGTPAFSHNGLVLIFNAHKDKVKLTFSEGASLPDSHKLFNSMLEGNKWRAIDFLEGDEIDERSLKRLIRAAVARNTSKKKE